MYSLDDTIAAIASPPGGAARGIVRITGPSLRACLEGVFCSHTRTRLPAVAEPTATTGQLNLPGMAAVLPCELYLWPNRRSYTGQPAAEVHTLGSRPLLEAVLAAVCAAGARVAGPGEFTLRAFLSGRVDLTQAEAVLGVVDAADAHQLDVALAQLAGGLAGPLQRLRDMLIDLLAHLEAGFDFADEDLPFISGDELTRQLDEAQRAVAKLAGQMASRGESFHAVRAVLIGPANSGKSSLFNALALRTGALVSEHPGTTRDYLTADLELDGVKCRLVDTAGIAGESAAGIDAKDGPRGIEQAAQAASLQQARQANVRILCFDSTRMPSNYQWCDRAGDADAGQIIVVTKMDLAEAAFATDVPGAVHTSSLTGEGIDTLRGALRDAVLAASAGDAEVVAGTAVRCRRSLELAAESLVRAQQVAANDLGEELVAAEVRIALTELGKVAGAVCTDDLLDRIFSRFCIGK